MLKPLRLASNKALCALADPLLLFWALVWLMALLVLGTVAERYIGLYQSQRLFFGSFLLWLGPVPTPGAYLTLGLIALSLVAKLAVGSSWKKKYAGTLLTHASALILLAGGLFTALQREEGYIVLAPGETAAGTSDYNARTLVIARNGEKLSRVPPASLHAGSVIEGSLPFTLMLQRYCYPCSVMPRAHPDPGLRGIAQQLELAPARSGKEDANHQAGAMLEIRGASEAADGTYLAFEGLAGPAGARIGQDDYSFSFAPQERALPFSVTLTRFDKQDYPGTDTARDYRSEVTVRDHGNVRDAAIGMNAPLRHGGYTLYQSSYLKQNGKLYSVLAVVRDRAEIFPYIAIGLLCAGMLLHLALTLGKKRHK